MDKYRIVVIDDDRDTLSLLDNILSKEFEVLCCTNPLDILHNLDDIEPDILIIDVMMPYLDGRQVVKRIRQKPQFVDTPCIFLSVLTDRDIIIDAYKSGADLFLTKPITPKRFLNSLHAFLKRKIVPRKPKRIPLSELQITTFQKEQLEQNAQRKTPFPSMPKGGVSASRQQSKTPAPSENQRFATPVPREIKDELKEKDRIQTATPPVEPKRKICKLPRILIAINDPDVLDFLSTAMKDKYEIFTARNGLEMIRESDFLEPDLFIIDAQIPIFSGYQVCQMLKKSDLFFQTPVIMVSDKTTKKDVDYIKKLGVQAFIPKPFDFQQLDNAIILITQNPTFEIKAKIYGYDEIRKMRDIKPISEEVKEKQRLHRETKNIMIDFYRHHAEK
ncbi:response regulator transcription factor [Candidatus Sumerlaeota bacterium]|nr:response regulator transcription factor [Candidatus Sumerlaeota bacterium]